MGTVTIETTKDTYVEEEYDTAHGSDVNLIIGVGEYSDQKWRSLVEFDLSTLLDVPTDFIDTAVLRIYNNTNQNPITTDFRRIDNNTWVEATVKWTTQPSSTDFNIEQIIYAGWQEINIKSMLRNAISDGHNYLGILMRYLDESTGTAINNYNYSSDQTGDYAPRLVIVYDTYSQCSDSSLFCKEMIYKRGWGEITFQDHNCPTGSQVELDIKCPWGTTYYSVILNTDKSNYAEYSNGTEHYRVTVYFFTCNSAACDSLAGLAVTECYWDDDCYVKTDGDDSKSGTSWTEAWSTVDQAADEAFDGQEVHIGFGTYNNEPGGNNITPVNFGTVGIKYTPETAGTGGGTGSVTVEKN